MRRLWFRSTKRVISISVSDDIADFLSKQQNTSAFVSDLVRKAMVAEEKPVEHAEAPEPAKPQAEWTKEMERLWQKRRYFVARYTDKFSELEDRWLDLHFGDSGYAGEEEEWEKALAELPPEVKEYFNEVLGLSPAGELPNAVLCSYISRVEKEREVEQKESLVDKYGGNPDEVIWHGLTRGDIMRLFQSDKHYTVQDVASELGISYDQAYKHIVPWLKAQGIRIG